MTEEKKNGNGPFLSFIGELRDRIQVLESTITQFKTVDIYISELSSIILTYIEKAREGIVLIQDAKYVWLNHAVCDVSGYTREELLNVPVQGLIIPSHRDKFLARVKMLLAGDIIEMPEEWPILRKDRTIKYVNTYIYRASYMQKPALVAFFYDVTENKKFQEELSLRSQIMDSVNDLLFLMELTGKIVYVNDAVCASSGFSKEELLGTNILTLAAPELKHMFNIRMREFSEHNESKFTSLAVKKNGDKVPIEIRGKIVRKGSKQFLLGIVRIIEGY